MHEPELARTDTLPVGRVDPFPDHPTGSALMSAVLFDGRRAAVVSRELRGGGRR